MAIIGEVLFRNERGHDLDDVLRYRAESMGQIVARLPERDFQQKSDGELTNVVVMGAMAAPLEVAFNQAAANVEEVFVEVADRFSYAFALGQSPRVPGLRVTKSIPFEGDAELWRLRTNPWNTNPPRGEVRGQTLIVGIEVPAPQGAEAQPYLADVISQLSELLKLQRNQIERHNAGLPTLALPLIQQRRSRLSQASDILKSLQKS